MPTVELPGDATAAKACRIFISYKDDTEPDKTLASFLYKTLKQVGHDVFKADERMRPADEFSEVISGWIQSCDFFIVILTEASMEGGRGWVAAETEMALKSSNAKGHPQIVSVLANVEPPLQMRFEAAIGHLHHFHWQNVAHNEKLVAAVLAAIAEKKRQEPALPGRRVYITESHWRSGRNRESLAGTTLVPVVAGEETTLSVTRAGGPGSFRVRVRKGGELEVAIWSAAQYRRVADQPGKFVKMIENDNHIWCFERPKLNDALLLQSPSGSEEPVVVSFDTAVVKAVWRIAHERVTSQEERFLIVAKHS